MKSFCPTCGSAKLSAKPTAIVGKTGKYDIFCDRCGYISTGNVVNAKTGSRISADGRDVGKGAVFYWECPLCQWRLSVVVFDSLRTRELPCPGCKRAQVYEFALVRVETGGDDD